ncbi:hypothetical protein SDC9_132226 [bioreactor metagenome]|uniref:Uncharacterized protein n=1 Tax=bioreactor metagenome TaxID=1076179 RepID=A0A645D7E7_9ZZZZ
MFVNRHQRVDKERHKPEIFVRCLAGREKPYAGIGAQRPVVVFARSVYAGEWLFV